MLMHFSPYMRMLRQALPALPFDVRQLEVQGLVVPVEVKAARGYRELLQLLLHYATISLKELREVNPLTRR
jgi:hypothetical protein